MTRPRSAFQLSDALILTLTFMIVILLSGASYQAWGAPLQQDAAAGQTIFQQKCTACHTIGGGVLAGPDLKGITTQRDLNWLKSWIADPPAMVASGDPVATQLLAQYKNVQMPKMGLSATEIDEVLAFLQIAQTTPKPTPGPALPSGNVNRGKSYFTGVRTLQNGGPACISCHSIQSIGVLGGGSLGPELTLVLNRYGAAGLATFLQAPPTPTMTNTFNANPLTPAEQADLYTFLAASAQAGQQPAATPVLLFLGIGAVGAAMLFGLMLFLWPRQRRSISDELRRQA